MNRNEVIPMENKTNINWLVLIQSRPDIKRGNKMELKYVSYPKYRENIKN